ncbi:MAG TPA: DUF3524 domain-containing protein [Bacteroidetes bacterium]|nr:DUF3524 domain-containing protein [Bacteroidota bacterium]
MKIAILEPFLGGSHEQWAKGLQQHSAHEIKLFGLPGRHWKWRMHGGAVSLARQLRRANYQPDLLLATDMLDLGTFLGLNRDLCGHLPVALYFHENQLAYPWSPKDADPGLKRDNHYSFINFTSALAADRLFFNSAYNQESFLDGLGPFLKAFPDHRESDLISKLRAKAEVLPLGLDLRRLDVAAARQQVAGPPVVLWNLHWEFDKNPGFFFETLIELAQEGLDFQLVVLGEGFARQPPIFKRAREVLASRILHWGYVESQAEYAAWLWRSDLLPVTSQQDFFGGSIVEAMYCGVHPLLPQRLAYPEHVPKAFAKAIFYSEANAFKAHLRILIQSKPSALPVREWVATYDWQAIAPLYDSSFVKFVQAKTGD